MRHFGFGLFVLSPLLVMVVVSGCPAPGPTVTPYPRAVSQTCFADADCATGVCEGQGCGPNQPGQCVQPRERQCTMDRAPYCGCDGQTFYSSGSCPGRRFASRGQCGVAQTPNGHDQLADVGETCLRGDDCASGFCEGKGCGPDEPGVCKPKMRHCSADNQSYCGCDGKVFFGSGSCPGKRYASRGVCPMASSSPPYPDGAACWSNSECGSGTCEGQGCNTPGKCMPQKRMCTNDLAMYCGCDGKEFQSSGSCPGKRYAYRGQCKAPSKPTVQSCSTSAECGANMVCEGQGCGPGQGTCVSTKNRACTKDLTAFCGCDGQNFRSSSTCPGKRYAHHGQCKDK